MTDPARSDSLPPLADTSLLREPPSTARGVRTRVTLVRAARTVFEQAGYLDARLSDITKAAGCSAGTFYTYFANKEEILHAVLDAVQDEMFQPGQVARVDSASPTAVIEATNRAYLVAYQRNAKLMMLLEQVATIDPRFRAARVRRNRAFVDRNARGIERLQQRGLVDGSLDPHLTARALSAMVSRTAYTIFCLEDESGTIDELTSTLTRLWANALRLEV